MRRGIAAVVGSRICDVVRPKCRLKPILISPEFGRLRRRVVGRTIIGLDRIGKRVVIRLDHPRSGAGDSIVIEPRMTGLVLLADPPEEEHLRLTFRLSGGTDGQLMFWDRRGLGTVRLVPASDFERRYGLHVIGPDALRRHGRRVASAIGRQPPRDQGGAIGPEGRRRHRQPVRLRNSASGEHPSQAALQPSEKRRLGRLGIIHSRGPRRSHPLRRLDAV